MANKPEGELITNDERLCIAKLWGYEEILVDTPRYCGKILHFDKGFTGSLHYHRDKDETFYVMEGIVEVEFGPSTDELVHSVLFTGEVLRLPHGTWHRVSAAYGDAKLIEFSTHHDDDDVVRYESSRRLGS